MRNLYRLGAVFVLPLLLCNAALHAHAQDSAAPMEKKEQESLYSTIQSFVGRWWNGSELFPDPCGSTPVQGVLCDVFDGLWYVTALSVGPVMENSLDCARDSHFPLQLFELGHLRSLSVFSCFSDPARHPVAIPSKGWEKLSGSLESLEARSNRGLTGEVPAAIGALNNLQSLVLEENKLSGELPHELGELSKLRRLVLSGNQFSGSVPASLGSAMSELLILDLSRNALKGLLPPAAGGLRSLEKLDLSSNLLGGVIPAALGELRSLTLLDLRNNNFSGGGAAGSFGFLRGMAALQELLLSNNPLGGEIGSFPWASLENLSAVGLSNTFLGGEIPAAIAGLKGLRFLALDNNRLRGGVPPELESLPAVGALYLSRNNLSGRLQFSSEFYRRMGTRFAAWGNPNLCYAGGGGDDAPIGVQQCRGEQGLATDGDLGGGTSGLRASAAVLSASSSFAGGGGGGAPWAASPAIFLAALLL